MRLAFLFSFKVVTIINFANSLSPSQVDSFPINRTFEIESDGENDEESEEPEDEESEDDPDEDEEDEDCDEPDSEDSEEVLHEGDDESAEDLSAGGVDAAQAGGNGNVALAQGVAGGGAAGTGGKNYGKKFMLKCDELDIPIQSNNTQARLEALLEAAGKWRWLTVINPIIN